MGCERNLPLNDERHGMQLVLSPKLTGAVEHVARTHTEECYESDTGTLDLETLWVAYYEWK